MIFKSTEYPIGADLGMDSPNDVAIVRIVDISWLPQKTSQEVMDYLRKGMHLTSGLDTNSAEDLEEGMDSYGKLFDAFTPIIPHVVKSWTLKDPDTDDPLPQAKAYKDNPSGMDFLNLQMVMYIINHAQDEMEHMGDGKGGVVPSTIPPENMKPLGDSSSENITALRMRDQKAAPLDQPLSLNEAESSNIEVPT